MSIDCGLGIFVFDAISILAMWSRLFRNFCFFLVKNISMVLYFFLRPFLFGCGGWVRCVCGVLDYGVVVYFAGRLAS